MGFFLHLIRGTAHEVEIDAEQRVHLFKQHLESYAVRENLVRFFDFGEIRNGRCFENLTELANVLRKIDATISRSIITEREVERLDEEILNDLERLRDRTEITQVNIGLGITEEKGVKDFFKKLHDLLLVEVETVRMLLRNISEKNECPRELLTRLFQIIFHDEAFLYERFKMNSKYAFEHANETVREIVQAFLLGKKIEQKEKAAEQHFVHNMRERMGKRSSKERALGERIFLLLLEQAEAPWRDVDEWEKGIKEFERLIESDHDLDNIIRKAIKRRKYSAQDVSLIREAFRAATSDGHFEELEGEFYT